MVHEKVYDAFVERFVERVKALRVGNGLDPAVQVGTPIGPAHKITRAQNNIIVEIDGRPALDVFKEDIGELLARDLRRVAGYIFAALPITGSDTGDYLVRNLVGIDPNHGLIAIGDMVEPGRSIMFARRDLASAQADLERMLAVIKKRLKGPPRGPERESRLNRPRRLVTVSGPSVATRSATSST